MNAGKGWRHWKTAPDWQMKSCLSEDCPLMCAQCRSSGQCCIDSCRSPRVGPCLKTNRILQIQSCWQGSKMMFPIVNCRELHSLPFLEKSIPLPCLSFLLSVFFEDKCSQASPEGFLHFPWIHTAISSGRFGKPKQISYCVNEHRK